MRAESIKRTIAGLLIGGTGGLLFSLIGFPAPWIAGSMIASVAAIYSGLKIELPQWLRTFAFILLGIQTGGSVSWGTLERAAQWPLSVSLLAVSVVAVTAACAYFFRRLYRWDRATALFASLPGALPLTLALADEARADMQRVTIAQCIRLFFLVAALPAVISLMSAPPAVLLPTATYDLRSIFLLIMACSAGGFLLERLRIPAGLIFGAIFVSAVLHLAGSVIGGTPNVILIPTNVILGVMIGGRFKGLPFAEIRLLFREGFCRISAGAVHFKRWCRACKRIRRPAFAFDSACFFAGRP